MEYQRLGLGLGFFYFIMNLPPLHRDVTCFRRYLEGLEMRRKCQMNTLHRIVHDNYKHLIK